MSATDLVRTIPELSPGTTRQMMHRIDDECQLRLHDAVLPFVHPHPTAGRCGGLGAPGGQYPRLYRFRHGPVPSAELWLVARISHLLDRQPRVPGRYDEPPGQATGIGTDVRPDRIEGSGGELIRIMATVQSEHLQRHAGAHCSFAQRHAGTPFMRLACVSAGGRPGRRLVRWAGSARFF